MGATFQRFSTCYLSFTREYLVTRELVCGTLVCLSPAILFHLLGTTCPRCALVYTVGAVLLHGADFGTKWTRFQSSPAAFCLDNIRRITMPITITSKCSIYVSCYDC